MLDQRYRGLAGAAEDAARQPEFATVRRRAARLRGRRRAGVGVAAAVLAVLGAVGLMALPPGGGSAEYGGAGDALRVHWAGAADAEHLYAVVSDCTDCPPQLTASDDGGRTWQRRGETRDLDLTVVGPEILIESGFHPVQPGGAGDPTSPASLSTVRAGAKKISVDGGRTWKDLDVGSTPVATVPAGTKAVGCAFVGKPDPCRLYAVDPATGRVAPLAVQPPLTQFTTGEAPATAGVWVQGIDPITNHPATAVSRDSGRTWTVAVFGAEPAESGDGSVPGMYLPYVTSTDGNVAYALFAGQPDQPAHVYRSTDGGAQWQRTNDASPMPASLAGPLSMVTSDGTHVVVAQDGAGFHYLASPDGTTYTRVDLAGLPPLGHVPRAIGGHSFLVSGDEGLYLSTDGRTWQRLPLG